MKRWAFHPWFWPRPRQPWRKSGWVVDEMRTREESLRLPAVVGAVGFPSQAVSKPPTTPWTEAPYPQDAPYPPLLPLFFPACGYMGG